MNIGVLLMWVGIVWAGSEILLAVFRRSGARDTSHDAGSMAFLNVVIYGSIALAIFIASSGVGMIHGASQILAWTGLDLILLGLIVRWTAILTLRQYFTVNVAIQPGHYIVRKGMYRLVRHPSYSGSILSFIGLGVALSNWIALVVLLAAVIGAFIRRINIEERALAQAFGPEYEEYCRTTWRLVPGVW
jgi:protein-S-isoprenylcysteine O-methyltransferase